jgi:hypothetical protein
LTVTETPDGMALATVEIYLTDAKPERAFVIAGEPTEANRCARRLVREFDVPAPADGQMISLYITKAELSKLMPILERFPTLGFQELPAAEAAEKVRQRTQLTPKQVCCKHKAARPTEVFCPVLGRSAEGKAEMTMEQSTTDWGWLAEVEREGFDWHGPLGPTYWRVIPSHYCSTFFHPHTGQPTLLMSRFDAPDSEQQQLWDEHTEANPDLRNHRNVERGECPWLCLAYEISPEVHNDNQSDEQGQQIYDMIRTLLKRGYEFMLAHDLPLDKAVGFYVDDAADSRRRYLLTVSPDDCSAHLHDAPPGSIDRLRASPNFHYLH